MSDFQQQALKLAAQQQSPAWLADIRARAANDWNNVVWPTRKTEHWKYTPLASLQKNIPSTWSAQSSSPLNESEMISVARQHNTVLYFIRFTLKHFKKCI